MDLTPNFKLPLAGADDTGATALYLEALARKIDTEFQAERVALDGVLRPLVHVGVSTGTDAISGNFENSVFGLWDNLTTGPTVAYTNFPPSTTYKGDFPLPGWWSFGAANLVHTLASGTADQSGTCVILEANSFDVVPGRFTNLLRETRVYLESNTGGEICEISGTVYLPPGVSALADLKLYHEHAVNRNVSAGTVYWRAYLGAGETTGR